MKVAFWGGCINQQKDIAKDRHYHAILKTLIAGKTGITPEIDLRFYSTYQELKTKSHILLQHDKHFDYFVVFIRPFAIVPLTKLFVRYTNKKLKHRITLHPKFSKIKYYDFVMDENKIPENTNEQRSVFHHMLKRVNAFASDTLRLKEWANNEIISILNAIGNSASLCNTKLILIGPSLYPANNRTNDLCILLNQNIIKSFSENRNILHTDIAVLTDNHGHSIFEIDGKHFSDAGHAFIAQKLFNAIAW